MDGALLGGLLAFGLAGLALIASFAVDPPADADNRGTRLIGRAFIAGVALLGLSAATLAWSLESQVDGLIGVALGILMGVGAWGVLALLRPAHPGPAARRRALVSMAIAEGLAVLGAVGLYVAVIQAD
jgi:F0F1-type ATP synthase membrane subunit c/vacuolar-type H+-ATPase subunit K